MSTGDMPDRKTPYEYETSVGAPYNRPPDTEPMSDVVNPMFEERYGHLDEIIDERAVNGHIFNQYAEPHSRMWINNDKSVVFEFTKSKPNWWWRLWQFLLLGWRWQNV